MEKILQVKAQEAQRRYITAQVEAENGNRGVALVVKDERGRVSFGSVQWETPLRPQSAAKRRATGDDQRRFAARSPLKEVLLELRDTAGDTVLQAARIQGTAPIKQLCLCVMAMAGYAIGSGNLAGALTFAQVPHARVAPGKV